MVPQHNSPSSRGYQSHSHSKLPKLLLLLLLLCLVAPSSALSIRAKNYSMAEAQHSARDHGIPGGIIPTSANNVDSVDEPTSISTFTRPSSTLLVQGTSTTTLIIPEPPMRLSTTDSSVGVAISFSILTISSFTKDPLTSTPTLYPLFASLGTTVSMAPIFTPADPIVTIPTSNFGSLEHSTSASPPSTVAMSSSAATATPSPSETPINLTQQHWFIALAVTGITVISIMFCVMTCTCMRRYFRLARDRAPKREVELVNLRASRHAERTRDDVLNRSVPAPRSSLDVILAATPRSPTPAHAPTPASERYSMLKTNDGFGNGGPPMHPGHSSEKPDDEQWEALPSYPYATGE